MDRQGAKVSVAARRIAQFLNSRDRLCLINEQSENISPIGPIGPIFWSSRLIQVVLAELAIKRGTGYAQGFSGAAEVPFCCGINPFYVNSFQLIKGKKLFSVSRSCRRKIFHAAQRKIAGVNVIGGAKNHCSLNYISHLANVARPAIPEQ